MLKIRLSYVAAAAVLLSGVSAYGASSTFPYSVSEVAAAWYKDDIRSPRSEAHVGATGGVIHNAGKNSGKTGTAGRGFVRHAGESGMHSTFPASPNETSSFH